MFLVRTYVRTWPFLSLPTGLSQAHPLAITYWQRRLEGREKILMEVRSITPTLEATNAKLSHVEPAFLGGEEPRGGGDEQRLQDRLQPQVWELIHDILLSAVNHSAVHYPRPLHSVHMLSKEQFYFVENLTKLLNHDDD